VDGLTFVADMVTALAWPVTVLALALLFRKRIDALLSRPAKRWRVGPIEAEWEETAKQASEELSKSPEAHAKQPSPIEQRSTDLLSIAQVSPRAAVLDASAEMEKALRDYLQNRGADDRALRGSIRMLAQEAERTGALSSEVADAILRLSVLRNLAAHAVEPITFDQSADFIAMSGDVMSVIEIKRT
jgi:hypothetical protein